MKRDLLNSLLMTVITLLIFGVAYPLGVTAFAQWAAPEKANGQLIFIHGELRGSRLIGQNFVGDKYFHPRPSAAGAGYDAANSGGSNLAPTSSALVARIDAAAVEAAMRNRRADAAPIELVTNSASGLDPDISPAAAEYQASRVAQARGLSEQSVRQAIARHTEPRQFGVLGEPRVHVLELNLDLDQLR